MALTTVIDPELPRSTIKLDAVRRIDIDDAGAVDVHVTDDPRPPHQAPTPDPSRSVDAATA